jgi:AraC-like DNA-binding protein
MSLYSETYWYPLLGLTAARYWGHVPNYKPHTAAVYVICADDTAVKIGVSTHPERRVKAIQTGQDKTVRIFWAVILLRSEAYKIERTVHRRLADTAGKARGEWYYIDPRSAVGVIQSVIEKSGFDSELDIRHGMFRGDLNEQDQDGA